MDVAALSMKVDSSSVLKAANDLDQFSRAARGASTAAGLPNGSITRIVADVQRYATMMRALSPANDNAASSVRRLSSAQASLGETVRKTTGDIQAQAQALRDLLGLGGGGGGGSPGAGGAAGSLGGAFGVLEAAALAAAAALRTIQPPPGSPPPGPSGGGGPRGGAGSPYYGASGIEATGQAAEIAAHQAQNLFYQLNDVFVSLASGQKPLTVFIQQGSQIGQIYASTGLTLKGFALGLAQMLRLLKSTTAATEAAAFASAQQATASITAANAQAVSNVRAAETNIAIARTQVAMATTATEAAAANARLAAATAALAPAQAEAAITGRALATAQAQQASAASAAAAATRTSLTALGAVAITVTVALAAAVAGLAALTAQANDTSGLKKYTKEMGYTKEEVAKLNSVTVTFGDTLSAVFQVGMSRAADALGINTEQMAKRWNSFLSGIASATRATFAGIYATISTGAQLKSVEGALRLTAKGNGNLFTGLKEQLKENYGAAQRYMDDVVGQARTNALNRQNAMAKGFYDAPRDKKERKGGKTDAEKLADIYASAQADIAAEKARKLAEAQDLSATEALKLEKQTALLNRVQQAGIAITDAIRAKVGELADEYARIKIDADVAKAINAATDSIAQQRQAVQDETKLVGLYGDALERARRELEAQRALKASLPKGEIAVVANLTGGLSDDIEAQNRATRMERLRKDTEDNAYAMDRERKAFGLTGAAALQYAFVTERLVEAKRAGTILTDAEVAGIEAAGSAYAAQRSAIDRYRESVDFARESVRGFFSDWIGGAMRGESAIKAFGDATMNVLNRIIDRLLNSVLDRFLDSAFDSVRFGGSRNAYGVAGPDSIYAKGGTFGTAQRFANGGAFTNSVVTAPTLFRFANGAKLGEMGEAGPEAIMPLSRGPNGKLGVQMNGGGRPVIRMGDINLNQSFAGAVGVDSIRAMNEQSAREAVSYVRRNLADMLAEYDQNGVVAA